MPVPPRGRAPVDGPRWTRGVSGGAPWAVAGHGVVNAGTATAAPARNRCRISTPLRWGGGSLDGAAGDARDDLPLGDGEDDDQRQAHQHHVGEDEVPVVEVEPRAGDAEQVERQGVEPAADDE